MEANFRVYFNRRRQWLEVTLWDVHPTTFANWGAGRWGYFQAAWEHPKHGKFGEIHLVRSRVREDLIVHEMFHALCEWMYANRTTITNQTEERMAELLDSMVRGFYREYRK